MCCRVKPKRETDKTRAKNKNSKKKKKKKKKKQKKKRNSSSCLSRFTCGYLRVAYPGFLFGYNHTYCYL